MNANDLLDMIGDAKGSYIVEAQKYRSGEQKPQRKRLSLNRTVLIAAVIALMALLVGCAVVYVLSLQDMAVGESTYYTSRRSKEGDILPTEEKTTTLISLQNANQSALREWLEFTESYDPDRALMIANDNNESGIPEPYHGTYHCYTWEMVDKLDEIIEKYDLALLTEETVVQSYQSSVLLKALDLENLHHEDAEAEIAYGSGSFYKEGSFDISVEITLAGEDTGWTCWNPATFRYSRKDYFDSAVGSLGDVESYEQWNYQTADGTTVLLAMNAQSARIYADLPDAFIAIQMYSYNFEDQTQTMPKEALEQISDVFDYTIKPQQADMAQVEQLFTEANAAYEAQKAEKQAALYNSGYEAYVEQTLEKVAHYGTTDNVSYTLYDFNGDGVEELMVCNYRVCWGIVSTKNGQSYSYLDFSNLSAIPLVYPCEGNVIEVCDSMTDARYYFSADAEGTTYLLGLEKNTDGKWGLLSEFPDPDPKQRDYKTITEEEAKEIIDSYKRIEYDLEPIALFGTGEGLAATDDPYGDLLAADLVDPNARYVLRELNDDGIEELIISSPESGNMSIYSIRTGLAVMISGGEETVLTGLCEGNVFAESYTNEDGGINHYYYHVEDTQLIVADRIYYDPYEQSWFRSDGTWDGERTKLTEAEAREIIASYAPIELNWKTVSNLPAR